MTDAFDRLKSALADRYEIERELGAGGMATVYLAHDLKLHRKVALKVLRPELASALGPDRFLQEIDIAAKLNHPHILGLFDCGEADGFLYYVMPYVEGQSLRDKLAKEGELPIAEAVRILRDVVDALKHAHKHNVVHRDIKPDNVMLSEGHALVTDFGVAKAVSDATGAVGLTTEGVALGTPAYMSPEQASADPHIDHRADIYAVGVIAYELLTGRTPFVGNTQQELLAAHVTQTPDPVTKYRESVPPALAELVMKCLKKKAADRWQSVEELLPQLEALATPSGGVTPMGMVPVDRRAKRRWMMAGGAVTVAAIVAVVAVVAALPRGSNVALDPNHVVVSVFRNETGDPALDQLGARAGHWITQGLQQAAIPVTPWDLAQQSSEYVAGEAEAGRVRDRVRALAEETGAGTVVTGALYAVSGDSLEVQVNVTDARARRPLGVVAAVRGPRVSDSEIIADVQQRVLGFLAIRFESRHDWAPGVIGEPPTFSAYQAYDEGRRLLNTGNDRGAIDYFRRAHELDSTWAQPLLRMCSALRNVGRYAELDSVVTIIEGFGERLAPYDQAEVQYQRAEYNGDAEAALTALRRAVGLAPRSPAAYNMAMVLRSDLNRPGEALEVLRSLDAERGWLRENLQYWSNVTSALQMLERHEEALEAARRARELHPDRGAAVLRLQSRALAALGRIGELNDVLDEIEVAPDLGRVRTELIRSVEALRAYGHDEAAQEVAGGVIQWFEARTPDEKETPSHRYWYGKVLYLVGRVDEAQRIYDALVEENPDNDFFPVVRAIVAAHRGDTAQARRDAEWYEVRGRTGESTGVASLPAVPRMYQGMIVAALGETQQAMALIRRVYGEPGWDYDWEDRIYLEFESLRDNPEFQELVRPKG